jgi:predicted GIY-YIG superfamily endonuclease
MLVRERIPHFYGVYAIRNRGTGAMYVGCTQSLRARWDTHVFALRAGRHDQPLLQSAWDADGADAFELVMLEWVNSAEGYYSFRDALREAERRWLVKLMAEGAALYNKTLPQERVRIVDETEAAHVSS